MKKKTVIAILCLCSFFSLGAPPEQKNYLASDDVDRAIFTKKDAIVAAFNARVKLDADFKKNIFAEIEKRIENQNLELQKQKAPPAGKGLQLELRDVVVPNAIGLDDILQMDYEPETTAQLKDFGKEDPENKLSLRRTDYIITIRSTDAFRQSGSVEGYVKAYVISIVDQE